MGSTGPPGAANTPLTSMCSCRNLNAGLPDSSRFKRTWKSGFEFMCFKNFFRESSLYFKILFHLF